MSGSAASSFHGSWIYGNFAFLKAKEFMSPVITTERLRLRPFRETDAPALLEYMSRPRVNCFQSERLPNLVEALHYIEKQLMECLSTAICLKDPDLVIGHLFAEKEGPDTFGIGWVVNAPYEGKGLVREAAEAFMDYLFREAGARRLYGYVEVDNVRSQNLCRRLGMRYEGCFREFISFVDNPDGTPRYEDTCVFAILRKEWESNRRQAGK